MIVSRQQQPAEYFNHYGRMVGLSALLVARLKDKEGDKEYVQGVLLETWESADDWFA